MTVKKIAIALAACLLAFSLSACTKTVAYKDDVSTAAISESITAKIPVDGGYDFSDADFLTYYFEGNPAIDDFVIAASSASSDVNEFGILHVNDIEQIAEVDKMAQVYLSNQLGLDKLSAVFAEITLLIGVLLKICVEIDTVEFHGNAPFM